MMFIYLAIISMATLICWDTFIPIIPELSQKYSVQPELMTYGITVFALSYVIFSQFTAYIIDKYSPKRVVKIGLCIASVTNILFIFVDNFYVFLILRVVLGCSLSVTICINSIISHFYTNEESIKIFSYLNLSAGLGLVLAPLTGIQISQYLSYKFVFIFQSIYCFICYLCMRQILTKVSNFNINDKFNINIVANLIKNKHLIYISMIRVFSYLPHFIFVVFSSIFMLDIFKFNSNIYSLTMVILGVSCILGGYISKILNDSFSLIKTSFIGIAILNIGTMLFLGVGYLMLETNSTIIIICIYLVLISIGRSLLSPFCSKVLIDECKDAISSASSLSMIYIYLSCSLVTSLISQVSDLKYILINISFYFEVILLVIFLFYCNLLKSIIKR